jgi:hypothetical protein
MWFSKNVTSLLEEEEKLTEDMQRLVTEEIEVLYGCITFSV